MVSLLQTKKEVPNTASLLAFSTNEDKSETLSFAKLLENIQIPEKDAAPLLDGKQIPKSDTKESLVSLLNIQKHAEPKQTITITQHTEQKQASTSTVANLTLSQLADLETVAEPPITKEDIKTLIKDAKNYLQTKIKQTPNYQNNEKHAELPTTLKGLMEVAKKENIAVETTPLKTIVPQETFVELVQTPKILKHTEPKQRVAITKHAEAKQTTTAAIENLTLSQLADLETVAELPITKEDIKTLIKDAKNYLQTKIKQTPNSQNTKKHAELPTTLKGLVELAKTIQVDISKLTLQEIRLSPAASKVLSTNEIVQVKNSKHSKGTASKTKTEDTFGMLLQGIKAAKKDTTLTADFSVQSAKVIAPERKKEAVNSLESLLNEHQDSSEKSVKPENFGVNKADSLEVKMHEAKQMMRYLSHDVKNAIDNYKAPFTRLKVQLNPQHLGDVELTVVQRGKNLHVNLSSNNTAINILQMNAQDLKVQLQNSGINNATLNFNNSPSGGDASSNSQAQQHQHNRQHAQSEYNYFENEEHKEEILSSLEIVVPSYA